MKRSKTVLIYGLLILIYSLIGIEMQYTNTKYVQAFSLRGEHDKLHDKIMNYVRSKLNGSSHLSCDCALKVRPPDIGPLDIININIDPKLDLYSFLDSNRNISNIDQRQILNTFDQISAETSKNISNVHDNINSTTTIPHHHIIYYALNPLNENNKNNITKIIY